MPAYVSPRGSAGNVDAAALQLFFEGIAVNSVMPGHTPLLMVRRDGRAFQGRAHAIYFVRPLVAHHLPIILVLSA